MAVTSNLAAIVGDDSASRQAAAEHSGPAHPEVEQRDVIWVENQGKAAATRDGWRGRDGAFCGPRVVTLLPKRRAFLCPVC